MQVHRIEHGAPDLVLALVVRAVADPHGPRVVISGEVGQLLLDEFALILHLQDVYWSEDGRTSVDAVFAAVAVAGLLILGFNPSTDTWASGCSYANPTNLFTQLIEGGILNEIKLGWGPNEIKIISMYRPCADQLEGSLRRLATDALGGNLDDKLVEHLGEATGNPRTMLGGDFNLEPISAARFPLRAGLRNSISE